MNNSKLLFIRVPLVDLKEALLANQMGSKEVVVYGMWKEKGIKEFKMLRDSETEVSHQTDTEWYVG